MNPTTIHQSPSDLEAAFRRVALGRTETTPLLSDEQIAANARRLRRSRQIEATLGNGLIIGTGIGLLIVAGQYLGIIPLPLF